MFLLSVMMAQFKTTGVSCALGAAVYLDTSFKVTIQLAGGF
jgi:hypothetical protein